MEVKTITEQKPLLEVLPPGKRARLRRLLFEFGPGNGTLLLLPIDQGIEHGPRDFFPNPASKDPEYQFRLAAEAVAYTLYVGSPRQDADLHQLEGVREDCDRYGMPLMVWAYPRGSAIDKKGGRNSF